MNSFYKFLLLFGLAAGFGTCLATLVTHPAELIRNEQANTIFAEEIVNSSVCITGKQFDIPKLSGSGSIIKTVAAKDPETHKMTTKLYILSCAHLLQSGYTYTAQAAVVSDGRVVDGIEFDVRETEDVDVDLDLVIFEATINGTYPAFVSNKSLTIVPESELFRKHVAASGFPQGIGPIYYEGILTITFDSHTFCNIPMTHGNSGSVVYDLDSRRIVGVMRMLTTNTKGDIVYGNCLLFTGAKLQKFLSSAKSLE